MLNFCGVQFRDQNWDQILGWKISKVTIWRSCNRYANKSALRSKLYTINVLWLDWKKIKKNLNTMGTIFERATKCPYSSLYKYVFLHEMKFPIHKHKFWSNYLIQVNIRSVVNIRILPHIFHGYMFLVQYKFV